MHALDRMLPDVQTVILGEAVLFEETIAKADLADVVEESGNLQVLFFLGCEKKVLGNDS